MPYNVPKEKLPAMERCVKGVMDKGKDKDHATAICHTAIVGSGSLLNFQAATEADVLSLQASIGESAIWASADIPTSEIWKFEGACLARAEVNANNDGITDEGIAQLASTIRLMPLTEEHERDKPRGIFTKGYTNEGSSECLVDGFLWAGHWPEFAGEVRSGRRKLSMDAEAQLAVCNVCGTAFSTTLEYCEHIRHRSQGAVRWLYDLTAVAGGAVKNPAGSGTVFPGREGFTVISHRLEQEEVVEPPKKPKPTRKLGGKTMKVTCSECGHEHEIATDAEKVQAELDAKLVELQALQAKDVEAQAKIEEQEGTISNLESQVEAEKKVAERFAELAGKAGIEFAQEALPSLRAADDLVFKTFVAMASRLGEQEAEQAPRPPETVIASEGDPPATADTWTVLGG